mgnify:CR=1 FL=1
MGVEVHYLGYYVKWHPQSAYYYAVEHGAFQASPERLEPLNLTPLAELQLLRIVQEALTNVMRHSGQIAASVHVTCNEQELTLQDLRAEMVETMYPFYIGPTYGTRTLHADDVASISSIYPDPTINTTRGTISGRILLPNGTTRLSGVNVIARNLANPFVDSVSTFSGAFTDSTSQTDPNVGTYTLRNLTPGAQYVVFVDKVTALAGRFSNPVAATLPGPEEYWNSGETNENPPDDPLVYTAIAALANSTIAGTDIIFNQPGPGALPLGDDDSEQIGLPFTYTLCGQRFDSVFINSNGSLTFGSGDTDFSESAAEMLNDQPRIALLWDDLNPAAGGAVSFSYTPNTFTVRYEGVPEFRSTGSNTFAVTLHRSSNHIDIAYGGMTAIDGLAGVSCGSAVTSRAETASNLSSLLPDRINLQKQPAVYELFSSANRNDLANSFVSFNGTTDYNDTWAGPNNAFGFARNIKLPFDSTSVGRYTEIEPAGADVDYYSFTAPAGSILIAEGVSSAWACASASCSAASRLRAAASA